MHCRRLSVVRMLVDPFFPMFQMKSFCVPMFLSIIKCHRHIYQKNKGLLSLKHSHLFTLLCMFSVGLAVNVCCNISSEISVVLSLVYQFRSLFWFHFPEHSLISCKKGTKESLHVRFWLLQFCYISLCTSNFKFQWRLSNCFSIFFPFFFLIYKKVYSL